MESLKELYKIGYGPSSSHTMGPQKAAEMFKNKNLDADTYEVELYGSLASTGRGHLTDYIIMKTLDNNCNIIFKPEIIKEKHTNAMKFIAYNKNKEVMSESLFYSVGGGSIIEDGSSDLDKIEVYKEKNFKEIIDWCKSNNKDLAEYVKYNEGEGLFEYLKEVMLTMEESIQKGLKTDGLLPGELKLERKAKSYYEKFRKSALQDRLEGRIYSYALAVSEENASAGKVVTAPTCGASGIIPSLSKALKVTKDLTEEEVLKALAVAGILGNVIKQNASISGAEVGCQGEVGVACSMGAGMAAYVLGGTLEQIEYAAEIALEHCLGMTCDPICGYVQVPCIERNAIYAAKAIDCAYYSLMSDGSHLVSFDEVIETMMKTGRDLSIKKLH